MQNALVDARFYPSPEEAKLRGPKENLNGGTEFRLRVVQVLSVAEFICAVEWTKDYSGPPPDHTNVPDSPFAYLRGGTICAVRTKLWDRNTARVLLGLEVVARSE
jgi:hypothetical protein